MNETLLTQDDIRVIDAASRQRLAEMACLLNSWCWPNELSNPETPDISPITKTSPPTNLRRGALREEIEKRIGLRAILTEWNSRKGKRGKRKYGRPFDESLRYIDQYPF